MKAFAINMATFSRYMYEIVLSTNIEELLRFYILAVAQPASRDVNVSEEVHGELFSI